MSANPETVRIKRKRDESAPDALLLERRSKRPHGDKEEEPTIQYVLQKEDKEPERKGKSGQPRTLFDADHLQRRTQESGTVKDKPRNASGNGLDGAQASRERRTFHLKRPTTPERGIKKRKAGKDKDGAVATFMEKRQKQQYQDAMIDYATRERSESQVSVPDVDSRPLKRPSRNAAYKTNGSLGHVKTDSRIERMEAIANSLHKFAVDEASKDITPKPKVTSMPKLSGQRSRALHQQRASQSSTASRALDHEDTSMDDDADYVYDTYVLAPSSGIGAAQVDAHDSLGNVGYLIITEEDQAVWETYIDEDPSDEEPSDEDDENAEDWYGADYPDDELASDDEYDRNAYGYRANGASDDEEYDEHTFSEDEYERQMNPWRKKTPAQFSKYLNGGNNEVDSD